jgi:hypothetical protein
VCGLCSTFFIIRTNDSGFDAFMVFYTIRQSLLYLFSPHSVPDFALYFLFTVNFANLQQRISSLASSFYISMKTFQGVASGKL